MAVHRTSDIGKVRDYLRKAIINRYGNFAAYARKEQVTLSYISNVLAGRRPIPDWMLKRFRIIHTEQWELTA